MGQFAASAFRQDLLANGIGDGRYAFRAYVPDQIPAAEFDRFEVFTSFPSRVALSHPDGVRRHGDDAQAAKPTLTERVRDMFRPLVVQLAALDREVPPSGLGVDGGRHLYEDLFGPSPIKNATPLHGNPLSAYTDYIRHKYELADVYDTTFAKSEYDAFLRWYLQDYSAVQGPKRAPLSSPELGYLNSAVEVEGVGTTTRAASFFIDVYSGRHLNGKKICNDDFVYWWAVEQSSALFVEDCLVPQEHVSLLRRVRVDVEEYPLSVFMEIFVSRNRIFDRLPMDQGHVRKMIYFAIMLYALRVPHILAYMPSRWLGVILAPGAQSTSLFDQLAASVFGGVDLLTSYHYVMHLRQRGFNVKQQKFSFFTRDGSRILAAGLSKPDTAKTDIQIIGPFQYTLGLGESCRLLGRLIETLGYTVKLIDFDLENCSPREARNVGGLDKLSAARVNIVHLNPEALPAAIAYSPDVFTDAYNIAFCYWELDLPGDCQLLGLTLFDEIWTASTFVADAFRPFCKSVMNVGMACEVDRTRTRGDVRGMLGKYGITSADFVFLSVSDALSRVQRKNPIGAIRAFSAAFPNHSGVKLIIKTHNRKHVTDPDQQRIWKSIEEVAKEDARIILIDETVSRDQHRALIAASDCLVSLHRAEGFGLDLIYALSRGVPLIATGYSGNLDFCNSGSVWLIDYEERYLSRSEYAFVKPGHKWADPKHDHAVATMQQLFADVAKRRRLSDNGRRFVEEHFSVEAISRRIDLRLREILSR